MMFVFNGCKALEENEKEKIEDQTSMELVLTMSV